jgi:hypothetical protein
MTKNGVLKIISLCLAAVVLLGSAFIFHSDVSLPYYRVYTLYTWNSANSDFPALEQRQFIQIYLPSRSDEYVLLVMPGIQGENDEAPGAFDFSKLMVMPLLMAKDEQYGQLRLFSYSIDEETDESVLDFQMNLYVYKNYLIPDLDNEFISDQEEPNGDPGDFALNLYPQYFATKALPPAATNPGDYLKKNGLYQLRYYDRSNGTYKPSENEYGDPILILLDGGEVYDDANASGEEYVPRGDAYASYVFKGDFLNITTFDLPDQAVGTFSLLYFQTYLFHSLYDIKFSILTSTFFAGSHKIYYEKEKTMMSIVAENIRDALES